MIISAGLCDVEGNRLPGKVSDEIREASERKMQEEAHTFGTNKRPIGLVWGYLDGDGIWRLTDRYAHPAAKEVWFG